MCAWLTERVSGVGVRGGKRGPWPSPVTGLWGAGSGHLLRPGFSESHPLDWGARKELFEARTVQRVENLDRKSTRLNSSH